MSKSYVPPFSIVKQSFDFKSTKTGLVATVSYESLVKVIQSLLRSVEFDEAWYLSTYPDIAEAISEGRIENAKQHFIEFGYFEGRLPAQMVVDESWYLTAYPDVASAVNSGEIQSGTQHFREMGYLEGRLPASL
jgi:hypothetical protein